MDIEADDQRSDPSQCGNLKVCIEFEGQGTPISSFQPVSGKASENGPGEPS